MFGMSTFVTGEGAAPGDLRQDDRRARPQILVRRRAHHRVCLLQPPVGFLEVLELGWASTPRFRAQTSPLASDSQGLLQQESEGSSKPAPDVVETCRRNLRHRGRRCLCVRYEQRADIRETFFVQCPL
jgi:hypothetical protein